MLLWGFHVGGNRKVYVKSIYEVISGIHSIPFCEEIEAMYYLKLTDTNLSTNNTTVPALRKRVWTASEAN